MEPLQHRWTVAPVPGSTHMPFQLPVVGLGNNDYAFARKATGILAQIILASRTIEDETDRFIESRCWERCADVSLPYAPSDFIRVTLNYALVFSHALEAVNKDRRRLALKPWLLAPRSTAEFTTNTIENLVQVAQQVVERLRKQKRALTRALNMNQEQLREIEKTSDPALHKVPATSPREIRLWCLLNTQEFHEKVQKQFAQGSDTFKKFWARTREIVNEGREAPDTRFPMIPGFEGRDDTKHAHEVGEFNPSVFFFCSGVTEKGERAHHAIHIGSTQEQLASWPGLWFLRRDARRISLDHAPAAWYDFYQELSGIESRYKNSNQLLAFREQLMNWRLGLSPSLPNRVTAQDCGRIPLLRSCGHHIGQAYSQGEGNLYGIGCCYICKLTIKYSEAKKLNLASTAEKFEMEDCIKLPWSCAEVASSKVCDDAWYSM